MPNQIYSLNPSTIIVTSSFEENVKKLESVCIPPKHIIDIYIESQRYAQNIRDMTNPMRFIEARGSEAEFSDIRFRQLERAYNDVVRSWSKLKPLSFIQQYEDYVAKRPNNTGIENGIASEIFFRFTSKQNKTLIVDPTPSFIKQQQQYGNQLIYTYSDDRYCQMCQYTKEKDNIKDISCMDEQSFDRVLYFARDSTPDEIQQVLENIKSALVEKASTGIYILMPTAYLEKRHSEGEFWDYLTENYTIFKIVLMPQSAVKAKRKKQCLLILQNKPAKNCREILVQKTKPVDEDKIEALEFRRIPFTSFTDRDRTLSEMYNTDYIDYSQPKRRDKPVEYKFTNEISIWVSFAQEDGKYRPYYSLYDYPNSDQKRKNTLLRGKAIKTRIPGKWYDTKEEALASAEFVLLQDDKLADTICDAVEKQYSTKPISLKTFIFLRWSQLESDLFTKLFFQPNSAQNLLCSLMVGSAQTDEIMQVIDDTIANRNLSETAAEPLWKQVLFAFDHAVVQGYYSRNPIRTSLEVRREKRLNKADTRSAMVSTSFSTEDEKRFLFYLNSDTQNSELSLATLTRYYTGLPLSIFCALKHTDYIKWTLLDMGQLSITKYFPRNSTTSEELPEKKKRFVPLVSAITNRIDERIQSGIYKYKNQPLFSQSRDKKKPLTPRQMRDYYNKIIKKMDMPERYLSLADGENEPELTDVNRYGGDFLAANFNFHAFYDAKMEPEEIDFLVGRKPGTTEAQFYCDYNNIFMQLILRVKLDRWSVKQMDNLPHSQMKYADIDRAILFLQSEVSKFLTEMNIELDISECDTTEKLTIELFARFGANISVEFYEEET